MSFLTKVLGLDAKKRAETAAKASIADLNAQKEKLKAETDDLNAQRQGELKKTQKKQIRSLRSSFRTPGFSQVTNSGTKEKLG